MNPSFKQAVSDLQAKAAECQADPKNADVAGLEQCCDECERCVSAARSTAAGPNAVGAGAINPQDVLDLIAVVRNLVQIFRNWRNP